MGILKILDLSGTSISNFPIEKLQVNRHTVHIIFLVYITLNYTRLTRSEKEGCLGLRILPTFGF